MKITTVNKGVEVTHYMHKGMAYLNVERLFEQANNPNASNNTRSLAKAKLTILEDNNYRCTECLSDEYLTIDHINNDGKRKHDKAITYTNKKCTVLCVDCHLEKNSKINKGVNSEPYARGNQMTKKLKIELNDPMDVALLLSGVNHLRQSQLRHSERYLVLPEEFKKDQIFKELVDDYDRLNTLAAKLSELLGVK